MEEEELLTLFWQRDEEALRQVQKQYGKLCYQIAYNILQNRQDAQECENDSYFRLWNSIPPNRPHPLLSFLCRIVRNAALNRYEYNHAQKRNQEMEDIFYELDGVADGAPGRQKLKNQRFAVEDEIFYKELLQEINDFLKGRKEQQRQVFLARYYFAEPVAEIAGRFGISESKVKSMLFRIRKDLRAYLEQRELID